MLAFAAGVMVGVVLMTGALVLIAHMSDYIEDDERRLLEDDEKHQ